MLHIYRLSLAMELKIPTKQIIILTAAENAFFIYLHATNTLRNMLGKPYMISVEGGIIINVMIGNSIDLKLACGNIISVILINGRPRRIFESCFYNIHWQGQSIWSFMERKLLETNKIPYAFNIEGSVWWVSLCLLFYMVTSVFYVVMSACF